MAEQSAENKPLPCLACGQPLKDVGSGARNHPVDAVIFTAHGQYGSTVFDPMDGTYLEINICDQCLKLASRAKQVLLYRPAPRPVPQVETESWIWDMRD